MTHDEIRQLIALHSDDSRVADGHVYKIWEDGEITGEKGGDLYGCRNLHQLEYTVNDFVGTGEALPLDLLPHQAGGHAYMIGSHEGVFAVRRAIWPSLPEVSLLPPPRAGEQEKSLSDAFVDMTERRQAVGDTSVRVTYSESNT